MISESLKEKYHRWLDELIDEVVRNGTAKVMLADDLICEITVKGNALHWRQLEISELESPAHSA